MAHLLAPGVGCAPAIAGRMAPLRARRSWAPARSRCPQACRRDHQGRFRSAAPRLPQPQYPSVCPFALPHDWVATPWNTRMGSPCWRAPQQGLIAPTASEFPDVRLRYQMAVTIDEKKTRIIITLPASCLRKGRLHLLFSRLAQPKTASIKRPDPIKKSIHITTPKSTTGRQTGCRHRMRTTDPRAGKPAQ